MFTQRTTLVLAVAGLAAVASADMANSTFDTDAEGWMLADGNSPQNQSVTTQPSFQNAGGNTGGFITTAIDWPGQAFFVAPASFLGDESASFDGTISVDRRFVQPDSWADTLQDDYAVDLTITGLNGGVTLAVDLPVVSLDSWGTYEVDLSAAGGWFFLDSGDAATDADILAVLGDLEDIRVRGNIRDSFGRIGVDNFSLVPAPSALGMLGLAGVGVLRRRRR